jgi:ferredoxin-like protein FixX
MRIKWNACPHIVYTSDDEDQSGWQYLELVCNECGLLGVNVEDGIITHSDVEASSS